MKILRGLALLVLVVSLMAAGTRAYAAGDAPGGATAPSDHPKPEPGILVARVQADSPAAQAGLVRGDIVLAIDGDKVNTSAELNFVLRTHEPGDEITLTVKHGDEERTLTVTLGDRKGRAFLGLLPVQFGPRGQVRAFAMPFEMHRFPALPFGGLGMGRGQYAPRVQGAVLLDVVEKSAAAVAGLKPGDVIVAVDDQPITNGQELVAALAAHQPGDQVTLEVERDGETQATTVTLGANPDDETKAFLGVQVGRSFPMPWLDSMPGPGWWSQGFDKGMTPHSPFRFHQDHDRFGPGGAASPPRGQMPGGQNMDRPQGGVGKNNS